MPMLGAGVLAAVVIVVAQVPRLAQEDGPTAAGTGRLSRSHHGFQEATRFLMAIPIAALGRRNPRRFPSVASISIHLQRSAAIGGVRPDCGSGRGARCKK